MSGFVLFICLLLLLFPRGYRQAKWQHSCSSPMDTDHYPWGSFQGRWRWGEDSVWSLDSQRNKDQHRASLIGNWRHPLSWKQGRAPLEQLKAMRHMDLKWCSRALEKLRTLSDDSQVCLEGWWSHTNQCSQTAKDACGLWTNVTNSSLHFLKDGGFGRIFSLKLKIVFLLGSFLMNIYPDSVHLNKNYYHTHQRKVWLSSILLWFFFNLMKKNLLSVFRHCNPLLGSFRADLQKVQSHKTKPLTFQYSLLNNIQTLGSHRKREINSC